MVASVIIAIVVFLGTFAAATWADVSFVVEGQKIKAIQQKGAKKVDTTPVDPYANEVINILLIGQDTRDGDSNSGIGGNEADVQDLHNSDTTMILQISADRKTISWFPPRDARPPRVRFRRSRR